MDKLHELVDAFSKWKAQEPKIEKFMSGWIEVGLDLNRREVIITERAQTDTDRDRIIYIEFEEFKRIFEYLAPFFEMPIEKRAVRLGCRETMECDETMVTWAVRMGDGFGFFTAQEFKEAFGTNPPELKQEGRPGEMLKENYCHAGKDGDCNGKYCLQIRDGESGKDRTALPFR